MCISSARAPSVLVFQLRSLDFNHCLQHVFTHIVRYYSDAIQRCLWDHLIKYEYFALSIRISTFCN